MSYVKFCEAVGKIMSAAKKGFGGVRIAEDKEEGIYIARFTDGTTITGNPVSLKLTVRWASGHQAVVSVA